MIYPVDEPGDAEFSRLLDDQPHDTWELREAQRHVKSLSRVHYIILNHVIKFVIIERERLTK